MSTTSPHSKPASHHTNTTTDDSYPRRKSSTTTTLCSPSSVKGLNKKSFSSTVSSRGSSSTPLSIAERFMSTNYNNHATATEKVIEQEKQEEEEIIKIIIETEADNTTTPDYSSQNDRLLLTPPPLFLSYDSNPQLIIEEEGHHPLDNRPRSPKKKRPHQHCCCSSSKNTSSKKDSNKCSKTHNNMWEGQEQKKKKNNKIHHQQPTIIKIDDEKQQQQPTKNRRRSRGKWCCFIKRWKEQDIDILPGGRRYHQYFCFCGRREWVIITFLSVILSFVLAFVFWPRIPLIRIEGAMMTVPAKVTQTQHGTEQMMMSNVAFESVWLLNITMDNRRNYLTTRFNRIQIIAKDALTGLLIGKGQNDDNSMIYLPGHTISTIQLPISVNYQARDRSDTTFSNLLRACTNITTEQQHHSLSIQFWFTLYIFGLDWLGYKPSVIATPATGGFFCPSSSL